MILRLKTKGLSDYKIGCKLKIDPANVTHSRENASRKLERAKADTIFFEYLKEQTQPKENNLILKEGEKLIAMP
jgi:transcriptional regulator